MIRVRHETWREYAARVIEASLASGRALGLTGKPLRQHVRAHGWTCASNGSWPYRMWRQEYRALVLGKPRRKPPPPRPDVTGQGRLFGPEEGD